MAGPYVEFESLRDQASRVEQEARMILPGIQALFGFQLVAVFNDRFVRYLALFFSAVFSGFGLFFH